MKRLSTKPLQFSQPRQNMAAPEQHVKKLCLYNATMYRLQFQAYMVGTYNTDIIQLYVCCFLFFFCCVIFCLEMCFVVIFGIEIYLHWLHTLQFFFSRRFGKCNYCQHLNGLPRNDVCMQPAFADFFFFFLTFSLCGNVLIFDHVMIVTNN